MKKYTRNLLMGTALALTMSLPSMTMADPTQDEFMAELSKPFTAVPSAFKGAVKDAPIVEGYAEAGCWANCKKATTRRTQQAVKYASYALGKAGNALDWAEERLPAAKDMLEQALVLGKFSAALTGDQKLIKRLEYASKKFEQADGLAQRALAVGRGGQVVLQEMVNLADGIRVPELKGGVKSLLPLMTAATANFDTDSTLRWTDGGLLFQANNDHRLSPSVRIGALNALHMLGKPQSADEAFTPEDHVKANAWLTAFMEHDLSDKGVSRGDKEVLRHTFSTFDNFGVVKLVEEDGQAKIHIYDAKTIDVEKTQPVVEINLPYFADWNPTTVAVVEEIYDNVRDGTQTTPEPQEAAVVEADLVDTTGTTEPVVENHVKEEPVTRTTSTLTPETETETDLNISTV